MNYDRYYEPPWLDEDHFQDCPAHEDYDNDDDTGRGQCICPELQAERLEERAERRAEMRREDGW
jgi:hypothetical protein